MEVVLLLDVVDYSVVFCHMDSWFQGWVFGYLYIMPEKGSRQ